MRKIQRLPALPLITVDPYFSIWSCHDLPTGGDTRHWTGERKRLEISVETDGRKYRLLGQGSAPAAELTGCHVRPTITELEYRAGGADIRLSFCPPLLLDDLEQMSTPVTLLKLESGCPARAKILLHDDICYNGMIHPEMTGCSVQEDGLKLAAMGKRQQNVLGHSGDHICIDWGYAWMASDAPVSFARQAGHYALKLEGEAGKSPLWAVLAYDDVASICYFGVPTKAWYARNGRTIRDAIADTWRCRESLWSRCESFDRQLVRQAQELGGEDYAELVCASYRQSISAHKLIAGEDGKPVFLSKENSSNGCIGTADVSYPSIPLFLLYNPELVRAMCRPILRFASCPVWPYDFAPHDVGRYPYACGQVYSLMNSEEAVCDPAGPGGVHFPYYLLPRSAQVYDPHRQMPVEECGNMLLMLAAALKAACGLGAYGLMLERLGRACEGMAWKEKARRMAERFCAPVARYLRETTSRVPFSDWYETTDGRYVGFIARSVQGGVFMPLLRRAWEARS